MLITGEAKLMTAWISPFSINLKVLRGLLKINSCWYKDSEAGYLKRELQKGKIVRTTEEQNGHS